MPDASRPTFVSCAKAGLGGAAIAAAVNLALLFGATAAGISMVGEYQPGSPAMALPFPMVLVASIMPALAATVAYFGLTRFTGKASRIFVIVAVLFLLLSMGGPLTLASADTGTKLVLAAMHIVAAVAIAGPLSRLR